MKKLLYENVHDIVLDKLFLNLPGFVPGQRVALKLEGLNPAGSIKLKTAVRLVRSAEDAGLLPGCRLIESTSGNLGVALAVVCAAKGYDLTVVTDPNVNVAAVRAMEALGAHVVTIDRRDANGGFLQSRIDYIQSRLAREPRLHWLNQYGNPANALAHRDATARSIHESFGEIDALVIGVGTSGTLMGCVEYFREFSPRTRIVAVDSIGSVTFGGPPGPRFVPGLGTSRRPEIFTDTGEFEKVLISEHDAVTTCAQLARDYGLLSGGSTGTVLAAVREIAGTVPNGGQIVAISPDLGDRYLDTVYSADWRAERIRPALLPSA